MGTPEEAATQKTLGGAGSGNAELRAQIGAGPEDRGVRVSDIINKWSAAKNAGSNDPEKDPVLGSTETRVSQMEAPVDSRTGDGNDRGSGSVIGETKENGVENGKEAIGSTDKDNGIALLLEVHDSLQDEPSGILGEANGTEPRAGEEETLAEERTAEDETENDGEILAGDKGNDDADGELAGDNSHGLSVGDFVWGKIKSHPWWPGRIYDPSSASDIAAKYKQSGRFLVAYFGDGSFSWCSPSQLVPFVDNFEEMAKQSNSKSFLNAVDKAVEEVSVLVELKMQCSCIPEEKRVGWPMAMNAGIKAGVLVPDGDISRIPLDRYDPTHLHAELKRVAVDISVDNGLELALLRSWLAAFYGAKGISKLPAYHIPVLIEGLEDKSKNENIEPADFSVPIEVPIQGPLEEDWISSPALGSAKGCPNAEDKLYHKRKQKSVAELMGDDSNVSPKDKKLSKAEEVEHHGKLASGTRSNKVGDSGNDTAGLQVSQTSRKRGRKKKTNMSGSADENANTEAEGGVDGTPLSRQLESNLLLSGKKRNEKDEELEKSNPNMRGSGQSSASRERKKSKYLSPPYTNVRGKASKSGSEREQEMESEKITKITRVGERMAKAAGQLIGSTPSSNNSGGTMKKESDGQGTRHKAGQKIKGANIDSKSVEAPASKILSKLHSTALDPLCLVNDRSVDVMKEFISTFRRSVFTDEQTYEANQEGGSGRKRKLEDSEGRMLGNLSRDERLPDATSSKRKRKKIDQPESDKSKLKKILRESSDTEDVYLVVSFSSSSKMPRKVDIIRLFSKFGDVDEKETKVLDSSKSVKVVYKHRSNAEEAFKESVKQNPFGGAKVNYRLRYRSAEPQSREGAEGEESRVVIMKQKIEEITSTLEKCDGKISQREKSELEVDLKKLLEKASKMKTSSE